MKSYLVIIITSFCFFQYCAATNPIKEAHKAIKDAKYQTDLNSAKKETETLEAINKSLLEAITTEKEIAIQAELYFTAAQVQCKINDLVNERIYLKQEYDTTTYYNSIYLAYQYVAICDSLERTTNQAKSGKYRFRKPGKKILHNYRKNLLNGGRYYMVNKRFKEAAQYLNLYLYSAEYPMTSKDFSEENDSMYTRVAYWALAANFQSGNYATVVHYAPVAFKYNRNHEYIQEYVCRSRLALNDSAAWERELKTGVEKFPEHTYFFTALQECFGRKGKYNEALSYADSMIAHNNRNAEYWHAKAFACLHLKRWEKCVESANNVLEIDNTNADAYYIKGLAYCNMAEDANNAMNTSDLQSDVYQENKEHMIECYTLARHPLEVARSLSPKKVAYWAPLLYQVYLNLNCGTEFSEIETVVNKLQNNR